MIRQFQEIHASPPGPKSALPGRNLAAFMRSPLDYLTRAARDYGDIVSLNIRSYPVYLISDPEVIRDVLVTSSRKFIKSPFLQQTKEFLGEGLLTSEGELHLRQRRLIQPAFHKQRIASYARTMVDNALKRSQGWQDGQEIDLAHEMMRLTMSVVAQALFGASIEGRAEEIGEAITALLTRSNRLNLPYWRIIRRLPVVGDGEMEKAGLLLDRTIQGMIDERRKNPGAQPGDLLSMLLQARDEADEGGMSDRQVRDEALTLFLAGHETTALALTWAFVLLGENPIPEKQLHAELDQVLGRRAPTVEDIDDLRYTRMVFTEAMRLYPPAWVIGRQCLEDYAVKGYMLPKGAVILMSQWVNHRDPRYFSEPRRFIPERWANGIPADLPRFAYFPFGGGPRMCIGEPFAWMEGLLILATIGQNWHMRPNFRGVQLMPRITLRSKGAVRMVLLKRSQPSPSS